VNKARRCPDLVEFFPRITPLRDVQGGVPCNTALK
jgi:hypothetical protein